MEEEISLRELIETLWKGKVIIIVTIILAMLISFIVSWFVLEEQYTSKATIQVASEAQDAGILSSYVGAEFTPQIFKQRINNETSMNSALEVDGIMGTYSNEQLSITDVADTKILELTYVASSPELAAQTLQALIQQTKIEMNASIRSTLDSLESTYTSEVENISAEIEAIINDYNELVRSNNLSELFILQTMLSSQVVLSLEESDLSGLANVNPVLHNQLNQMQTEIRAKSEEYAATYRKYQSVKTGLDSFQPDPYIRTIVQPTIPENPSAPNKLLNLAIAMVVGLMLGVGIVFLREYWKNSAPVH